MLREACAAFLLAQLLGDTDAERHRKRCEGADAVDSQEGSALESGAQALLRLRSKRSRGAADLEATVAAAAEVCGGPGGAAVPVSADEAREGILRAETVLAVLVRLEVCGLVELRGPVLAAEVLASVASSQRGAMDELLAPGGADGSRAVERWKGRYEGQVPLAAPFTDEALVASPLLLQLVRLALGPRVEVDTFSHVTSLAGAPDQPWHTDVDLLFKEPGALDAGHHPAAGLVAIVPLLNLTQELGPTEFLAGSHTYVGEGAWEQFQGEKAEAAEIAAPPRLRPLPSLGSVVLFDLRVHHHGIANRADVPRSILYLSYVKDWFLDRLNFQGRQSSAFDDLGSLRMKKLLRRVDARTYIEALEAFATGRVDAPPARARPFKEPDLAI